MKNAKNLAIVFLMWLPACVSAPQEFLTGRLDEMYPAGSRRVEILKKLPSLPRAMTEISPRFLGSCLSEVPDAVSVDTVKWFEQDGHRVNAHRDYLFYDDSGVLIATFREHL